MDGFTLYIVVKELKGLAGAKIEKIYMPSRDEVHFLLRGPGKNRRLVINVNSSDYRIHLSEGAYKYPAVPPPFCMYLRKYLTGAQITAVEMPGLERIAVLCLRARDELGVNRDVRVVAELMGRHSNFIITDENGGVLECLKHIGISQEATRPMLPGLIYEYPKTQKADPLSLNAGELAASLLGAGPKPLYSRMSQTLQGLSNRTAQDIIDIALPVYTSAGLTGEQAKIAASKLFAFFQDFKNGGEKPHIFGASYSVLPEKINGAIYYPSANEMLDAFWSNKLLSGEIECKRRELLKLIRRNLDKRQKKLQLQLETLKEAQEADVYRKYADLITASLYKTSNRNARVLTVEDYYDGMKAVDIPLDEKYPPSVNAQRYYKKYGKLKTAAALTSKRLEENEAEIEFLSNLEYSAEECKSFDELCELEAELVKYGYAAQKGRQKAKEPVSRPLEFVSSDGIEIIVGRNSRQNDLVTMRMASPGDLWLHAKGPGSHVILKLNGREIPDGSLMEAAAIAAYYSKQRLSDKAAVDYAYRKFVRKPPGAKPGMVIYDSYRTINVKPDGSLVERLRVT